MEIIRKLLGIFVILVALLGAKMMVLYKSRERRDLFNLYWALSNYYVDVEKLIQCYKAYMEYSVDKPPAKK